MNDAVNKPSHYQLFADGTQSIDVIRRTLSPEEFVGFCKGNCLKYRLRAGKKDALEQDIAKAETYEDMLKAYLKDHPCLTATPEALLKETVPAVPVNSNSAELAYGINLVNSSCHQRRMAADELRINWGCLNCLATDCESA